MIIYRMQNIHGLGPYRKYGGVSDDLFDEVLASHSHLNGRPVPNKDLGINRDIEAKEICGFLSIRQAVKWFSKYERKRLRDEGFNIVKVEVKEITAIGKKQCLAIPYKIIPEYRPTQFSNDDLDLIRVINI